jgi:hypothetical protein
VSLSLPTAAAATPDRDRIGSIATLALLAAVA